VNNKAARSKKNFNLSAQMADPSTEFTLIVVNERGRELQRPATVEQCLNLASLQRLIITNDMTLEDNFGLGYEHPEYGAYMMVRANIVVWPSAFLIGAHSC